MNARFCILSALFTAVALPVLGQQPTTSIAATPSPARIIFDTDMDSDCDDAAALALLHVLADRGEAEILAIAASSRYRWSVPCIEVINRYYGRPDLPIGAPKRDAVDSHAGSKDARANFKTDPAATVAAARDWPVEVVFSGLGDNLLTGSRLQQTPPENPVRRAYELYLGKQPARPSWDPLAVLYTVRPEAPFWQRRTEGYNPIFPNGTNEWRSEPDSSTHVLLELVPGADEEVGRTIDELLIQPPRHRAP